MTYVSERSSIHPFTSSHDFLYLILQGVTSVNNTQSSPRSNIIIAIMLSALTYWLFAQSFINIGPLVGQTYQTSPAVLNLSISLTSFATGIFMVASGDIADKIGQLRMTHGSHNQYVCISSINYIGHHCTAHHR